MENVMVVSSSEKGTEFLSEALNAVSFCQIVAVQSCGEARRILLERDFDLVIINAPLRDESGEALSRHIAAKETAQTILIVKHEFYDAVSAICEKEGILVISKPLNKNVFWSALSLARSARSRIKKMQNENAKLKQKIEDISIVSRAKWALISSQNMNEQEAHRYIEKQSMDQRTSKRAIAEGILKRYENQ